MAEGNPFSMEGSLRRAGRFLGSSVRHVVLQDNVFMVFRARDSIQSELELNLAEVDLGPEKSPPTSFSLVGGSLKSSTTYTFLADTPEQAQLWVEQIRSSQQWYHRARTGNLPKSRTSVVLAPGSLELMSSPRAAQRNALRARTSVPNIAAGIGSAEDEGTPRSENNNSSSNGFGGGKERNRDSKAKDNDGDDEEEEEVRNHTTPKKSAEKQQQQQSFSSTKRNSNSHIDNEEEEEEEQTANLKSSKGISSVKDHSDDYNSRRREKASAGVASSSSNNSPKQGSNEEKVLKRQESDTEEKKRQQQQLLEQEERERKAKLAEEERERERERERLEKERKEREAEEERRRQQEKQQRLERERQEKERLERDRVQKEKERLEKERQLRQQRKEEEERRLAAAAEEKKENERLAAAAAAAEKEASEKKRFSFWKSSPSSSKEGSPRAQSTSLNNPFTEDEAAVSVQVRASGNNKKTDDSKKFSPAKLTSPSKESQSASENQMRRIITDLQLQLEEKDKQIRSYRSELQATTSKLLQTQALLNTEKANNARLEQELDSAQSPAAVAHMEAELASLRAAFEAEEKIVAQMMKSRQTELPLKEIQDFLKMRDKQDDVEEELTSKLKAAQQEITLLKKELEETKLKATRQKNLGGDLRIMSDAEYEELKSLRQGSEPLVASLATQLIDSREQLLACRIQAEAEISELRKLYDEKISQMERRFQSDTSESVLKKQVEELLQANILLKENVRQLQMEKGRLHADVQVAQARFGGESEARDQTISRLRDEVDGYRQRALGAERSIAEMSSELEHLRSRNADLEGSLAGDMALQREMIAAQHLRAEVQRLHDVIEEREGLIGELRQEVTQVRLQAAADATEWMSRVKDLEGKVVSFFEDSELARQEAELTRDALMDATDREQQLQTLLSEVAASRDAAESELDEERRVSHQWRDESEFLEQSLRNKEGALAAAGSEIRSLQAMIAALEVQLKNEDYALEHTALRKGEEAARMKRLEQLEYNVSDSSRELASTRELVDEQRNELFEADERHHELQEALDQSRLQLAQVNLMMTITESHLVALQLERDALRSRAKAAEALPPALLPPPNPGLQPLGGEAAVDRLVALRDQVYTEREARIMLREEYEIAASRMDETFAELRLRMKVTRADDEEVDTVNLLRKKMQEAAKDAEVKLRELIRMNGRICSLEVQLVQTITASQSRTIDEKLRLLEEVVLEQQNAREAAFQERDEAMAQLAVVNRELTEAVTGAAALSTELIPLLSHMAEIELAGIALIEELTGRDVDPSPPTLAAREDIKEPGSIDTLRASLIWLEEQLNRLLPFANKLRNEVTKTKKDLEIAELRSRTHSSEQVEIATLRNELETLQSRQPIGPILNQAEERLHELDRLLSTERAAASNFQREADGLRAKIVSLETMIKEKNLELAKAQCESDDLRNKCEDLTHAMAQHEIWREELTTAGNVVAQELERTHGELMRVTKEADLERQAMQRTINDYEHELNIVHSRLSRLKQGASGSVASSDDDSPRPKSLAANSSPKLNNNKSSPTVPNSSEKEGHSVSNAGVMACVALPPLVGLLQSMLSETLLLQATDGAKGVSPQKILIANEVLILGLSALADDCEKHTRSFLSLGSLLTQLPASVQPVKSQISLALALKTINPATHVNFQPALPEIASLLNEIDDHTHRFAALCLANLPPPPPETTRSIVEGVVHLLKSAISDTADIATLSVYKLASTDAASRRLFVQNSTCINLLSDRLQSPQIWTKRGALLALRALMEDDDFADTVSTELAERLIRTARDQDVVAARRAEKIILFLRAREVRITV